MKYLRYISCLCLLAILAASCAKEESVISPCTVSMPGKICKDYRYTPHEYLGSVEYFYDSKGFCVREDRYSSDHSSRHILFNYTANGLLLSRTELDDDETIRQLNEYYYNESDSLITESVRIDGVLKSISVFFYDESGKRIRQKTENNSGDVLYIEYQYDNNKLLKETQRDKFGKLLQYTLFDAYSNGVTRQRIFNAENQLIRMEIGIYDEKFRISERKLYREDMHLFQWEHWTYDQDLLIKYSRNNGDDFPLDYILYQY